MNPLQPPPMASPVLRDFLALFGLDARADPAVLLEQVATAYARLPYENLTKIIKEQAAGNAAEARRQPLEVVADHGRWGTGGTCFALTATLLHLVRALGWPAEPILADRHYGPDSHSGLLVWLGGKPHLLDPGYLIVQPLPVFASGSITIPTAFNHLVLTARDGGKKIDLATAQGGQVTPRLTFKTEPADPAAFLKAWDASFGHDLMHYPVLSRVRGRRQLYLQKNYLMERGHEGTRRAEIDPEQLPAHIAQQFGIDPAVAARALAILRRRGDERERVW